MVCWWSVGIYGIAYSTLLFVLITTLRLFPMQSEKHSTTAIFIFCIFGLISYLNPQHIHPLRTYYNEILIFLGLILATAYLARRQAPSLRFPSLLLLPLGILSLVLLQVFLGIVVDAFDMVLPIAYFLLCSLALVFGATVASQPDGANRLCFGLAIMHLLAALLSLVMQQLQIAGVDASPLIMFIARDAQSSIRPYANVAQPNQLALLYCLALGSVWYLYQSARLPAWTAALLATMLLWGVALTQSRIGWMILPLFALFCSQQKPGERGVHRLSLATLLLLYVGLVLGLPQIGKWLGFFSGSVAAHVGGRSERLVLLQQAWHMAAEHPWLGVGWFGFCAEQVRIAADFTASTYAEHAHNWLFNFAAELGWPATFLIFGALAWWALQTCVLAKAGPAVRFASLCLIAVLVHSMVEFPLWYAFVLAPVALLMGMLHQMRWPAEGVLVSRKLIILGAFCSCLLMLVLTLDYQRVVAGFNILRTDQSRSEAGKAGLARPDWTFFPAYFLYFDLMQMTPHEGMSAQQIAAVERMSQRFGFVHVLNKLAEVYVLNGEPKKAERTMLTLQRLHPAAYPEYFDYWKTQSTLDARYRSVLSVMPPRDAD